MMNQTLLKLIYISIFFTSCGAELERQEKINKLRTLGVSIDPVHTTSVDKSADITVLFAFPKGDAITATPFKDSVSNGSLVLDTENVELSEFDSADVEDFPGFQLGKIKAKILLPTIAPNMKYPLLLKYGVTISGSKNKENIVGYLPIFAEGSTPLKAMDIRLISPTELQNLAAGKEVDIQAELDNPNQEEFKIGWFASGGKITNRRAKQTKWLTPEAGEHTLLVTIRGKISKSFAMKAVRVVVQ